MSIALEDKVTVVPEDERLDFLPDLVGLRCMDVELAIFQFMGKLDNLYKGGYWDFVRINSGGGYLRPDWEGKRQLIWPDNCSDELVSADAAGIVVTLFALSRVSFISAEKEQWNAAERLSKVHRQITEFSRHHPEGSQIAALID